MPYKKEQVIGIINSWAKDGYVLFCVYCFTGLNKTKEGTYYCPNELCVNEQLFDKDGKEVKC